MCIRDRWEEVLKVDGVALKNLLPLLPSPAQAAIEATKKIDKESVALSVKKATIDEGEEASSVS